MNEHINRTLQNGLKLRDRYRNVNSDIITVKGKTYSEFAQLIIVQIKQVKTPLF